MSALGSATITAPVPGHTDPQPSTSISQHAQSVPRNINNINSIKKTHMGSFESGSGRAQSGSGSGSGSGSASANANANMLTFEAPGHVRYKPDGANEADLRLERHPVSAGIASIENTTYSSGHGSQPASPENIADSDEIRDTSADNSAENSEEAIDGNSGENEEIPSGAGGRGDLQFKKTDFRKSRTQSFQSVLSSASLKSLKHQFSTQIQPSLKRNPSTISQSNTRNFQSFIQAPVLSSVSNLRNVDDVEIGQRLPFDQSKKLSEQGSRRGSRKGSFEGPVGTPAAFGKSANPAYTTDTTNVAASAAAADDSHSDSSEDEDTYKEETTLQQQRLTQNALKKLSLSLAPIIRSEEDDVGPQARQLTTKSLNSSRLDLRPEPRVARDLRPVLRSTGSRKAKPYLPAEVDLSSFSSLTRQSKSEAILPAAEPQNQRGTDTPVHTQMPAQATFSPQANSTSSTAKPSQAYVERFSQSHNFGHSAGQKEVTGSTANASNPPTRLMSDPRYTVAESKFAPFERTADQNLDSVQNKTATNFYPGSSQKAMPPSMTIGRSRPGTIANESQLAPQASSRNHSNLSRPTHMSATLNQRDLNIGTHGQGAGSPHAGSFNSGKSHGQEKKLQQINGFRSPMYVPAVLRMTKGQSLEVTADEQRDAHAGEPHETQHREENSSATSIKSVDSAFSLEPTASPNYHAKTGPYELSKRQYDYILRAAPTRKHWVKDESVIECGISMCRKRFTFFERRHHCRKCGGIFCKEHTSHYLYINHLAQFTTGGRGTLSRVCDRCIDEYNEFMQNEFGVTCHRPSSRESLPQQSVLNKVDYRKEIFAQKLANNNKNGSSSGTSSGNIPMKRPDSGEETSASDQVAGSVPANWSWSSF